MRAGLSRLLLLIPRSDIRSPCGITVGLSILKGKMPQLRYARANESVEHVHKPYIYNNVTAWIMMAWSMVVNHI